ncbi:MAG: RteC domain-containing protein [Promethearchaeota archaeon]
MVPNFDPVSGHLDNLRFIAEDFESYECFQSSLNRYLSLKPENTIESLVQMYANTLHSIYLSWWHSSSIKKLDLLICRFKSIYESCEKVVESAKEDLSEYLQENEGKMMSYQEFIDNCKKSGTDFIESITDSKFKEKARYFYASVWSQDTISDYLEKLEKLIYKDTNNRVIQKKIKWLKSDTDLLELITALYESKAINNESKNLTRKDAIKYFAEIFSIEIKDAESKLTRATERKKDTSPFLTKLKEIFDEYCQKKYDKIDELRK